MTQDTDNLGCSYCGQDITAGQAFHVHLHRAGRFIHTSCLTEHRTTPRMAGKALPMWSESVIELATALEALR